MSEFFLATGVKKAGYAFGAMIVFWILDFDLLAFLSFLLTVFFLYMYRNPTRTYSDLSDQGVVSPVAGAVISVEEMEDTTYGFVVTIESSLFSAGILRSPFYSKIEHIKLEHGSRLSPLSRLFDSLNEKLQITFANDAKKVKVIHTLKRSPLDIEIFLPEEIEVSSGKSYGFASNARTLVYLPKDFRLNVTVGDKVHAGQNIIGYFEG